MDAIRSATARSGRLRRCRKQFYRCFVKRLQEGLKEGALVLQASNVRRRTAQPIMSSIRDALGKFAGDEPDLVTITVTSGQAFCVGSSVHQR